MPLDRIRNALQHPARIPPYLKAHAIRRYWLYRQRRNHGIFSVNLARRTGFFAELTWAVFIFAFCYERNLSPHVTSSSPTYSDPRRGSDYLAYFFEHRARAFIDANLVNTVTVPPRSEIRFLTIGMPPMTLERASMLVQRYLRIRPEIVDAVDRFCAAHFDGGITLGVHFRGTDKRSEAPRVSYEHCAHVIRQFVDHHSDVDRLFVASDESPFIEYVRTQFRSLRVSYCDDLRSNSQLAVVHPTFAGDAYRKGREALVNCLLLSRSSALIRTASTLSGWASIFNPQLPVVMLNRPYPHCAWFPDNAVLARATVVDADPTS